MTITTLIINRGNQFDIARQLNYDPNNDMTSDVNKTVIIIMTQITERVK
jgi:hypothetical protein